MRSWLTALMCIAVAMVGHSSPIPRTPTPKDALRAAIYKYNASSDKDNLYKLLRGYCIAIKALPQGKEYEIGFTLKKTACTKGMEDIIEQCEFINNGTTLTCNALVTIRFNVPKPVRTRVTCTED
ncbi:cathelicidin-related peptide Oh-Cath-like [Narcine bancroftii]|uniref:cathelicidin-related peptide Oh-Cath-like n=1 Tax=Narcine bancroftii TaxID=1343680 RepID=UPI0038322AC9